MWFINIFFQSVVCSCTLLTSSFTKTTFMKSNSSYFPCFLCHSYYTLTPPFFFLLLEDHHPHFPLKTLSSLRGLAGGRLTWVCLLGYSDWLRDGQASRGGPFRVLPETFQEQWRVPSTSPRGETSCEDKQSLETEQKTVSGRSCGLIPGMPEECSRWMFQLQEPPNPSLLSSPHQAGLN